jgi:surface carbohydrate biosynthesis protein
LIASRPPKLDVLIYDAEGSDVLLPYIAEVKVGILHVRREALYLRCFVLAVVRRRRANLSLFQSYVDHVIWATAPRLIATFIDNEPEFHLLSQRHPGVVTVAVQNGMRAFDDHLFDPLFRPGRNPVRGHVDEMFVYGDDVATLYRRRSSGRTHAVGSLLGNSVNASLVRGDTVFFVSQYRTSPHCPGLVGLYAGMLFPEAEAYAAELVVVPALHRWCSARALRLAVAGCSLTDHDNEAAWFRRLLGAEVEFLPRRSRFDNYERLSTAWMTVTIDSSLGYEMLARGARVAVLCCREASLFPLLTDEAMRFGWPRHLAENGPFWARSKLTEPIEAALDFASHSSDAEWSEAVQEHAAGIMANDPGNTVFRSVLAQYLAPPNPY